MVSECTGAPRAPPGLHSFLPWEHLSMERPGLDAGRSSCLRPRPAWSLACELAWAPHSAPHPRSAVAPGWCQAGPEEDLMPGATWPPHPRMASLVSAPPASPATSLSNIYTHILHLSLSQPPLNFYVFLACDYYAHFTLDHSNVK